MTRNANLAEQEVEPYLSAIELYAALIPKLRARVAALVDFDKVEPREFWRGAFREATAETGFDPNPLIDAMFDADRFATESASEEQTVGRHIGALEEMMFAERDPARLAAATMLLAISLGFAPAEASEMA